MALCKAATTYDTVIAEGAVDHIAFITIYIRGCPAYVAGVIGGGNPGAISWLGLLWSPGAVADPNIGISIQKHHGITDGFDAVRRRTPTNLRHKSLTSVGL